MSYNNTPQTDCNRARTLHYNGFTFETHVIETTNNTKLIPTLTHNTQRQNSNTPDSTVSPGITSRTDDNYSFSSPQPSPSTSDNAHSKRASIGRSIKNLDAYWARFRLPRKEWLQKEWNRGGNGQIRAATANSLQNNLNKYVKSINGHARHSIASLHNSIDNNTVGDDSVASPTANAIVPSLYPTSTTLEEKLLQKRKNFMQKYMFSSATEKRQKMREEDTESEVRNI
jgi:hypothetical protein